MNANLDDEEELVFDDNAPSAEMPDTDTGEEAAPAAPEPTPEAPAPTVEPVSATAAAAEAAPSAPAATSAPASSGDETPSAGKPKKSLTGMAVAGGFAICILASTVAAIQSWRAASIVADTSLGASAKDMTARLAYLQKVVEQQRDTLDSMNAHPGAPVASDNDQINALATAVRANQAMNERLPSMIMQQVDARLAHTKSPRPVARTPAAPAKTGSAKPGPAKASPAKRMASATKPAAKPLPLEKISAQSTPQPEKRPAGEAIRYP